MTHRLGADTRTSWSKWLEARDEPGDWTFAWKLLVVDGDTAFVQGLTTYVTGPTCDNMWVITFGPDGQASEFTECSWPARSDYSAKLLTGIMD